jgi:hypothetical protein
MAASADRRRGDWAPWTVVLPATAAGVVTVALGSVGWLAVAFGVGSDCTDDVDCGSGSCAPCAAAHSWVIAGGIGQWALAVAALALLVLGMRQARWRGGVAVGAWALVPLAGAWIVTSTVLAQRTF